jgi:hypothetical protein
MAMTNKMNTLPVETPPAASYGLGSKFPQAERLMELNGYI